LPTEPPETHQPLRIVQSDLTDHLSALRTVRHTLTDRPSPFAKNTHTMHVSWTVFQGSNDRLSNLVQQKPSVSPDRTTNSHQQVMNWTNSGCHGPSVPIRRTVCQARIELGENENVRSTPSIHPWISEIAEWIETRFGEDVKRP
jgi:hypothetical protein